MRDQWRIKVPTQLLHDLDQLVEGLSKFRLDLCEAGKATELCSYLVKGQGPEDDADEKVDAKVFSAVKTRRGSLARRAASAAASRACQSAIEAAESALAAYEIAKESAHDFDWRVIPDVEDVSTEQEAYWRKQASFIGSAP